MGIPMFLLRGCLTILTTRDATIPLCGVRVRHEAEYGFKTILVKTRYPGCLAHAEISMFYSVVVG